MIVFTRRRASARRLLPLVWSRVPRPRLFVPRLFVRFPACGHRIRNQKSWGTLAPQLSTVHQLHWHAWAATPACG